MAIWISFTYQYLFDLMINIKSEQNTLWAIISLANDQKKEQSRFSCIASSSLLIKTCPMAQNSQIWNVCVEWSTIELCKITTCFATTNPCTCESARIWGGFHEWSWLLWLPAFPFEIGVNSRPLSSFKVAVEESLFSTGSDCLLLLNSFRYVISNDPPCKSAFFFHIPPDLLSTLSAGGENSGGRDRDIFVKFVFV